MFATTKAYVATIIEVGTRTFWWRNFFFLLRQNQRADAKPCAKKCVCIKRRESKFTKHAYTTQWFGHNYETRTQAQMHFLFNRYLGSVIFVTIVNTNGNQIDGNVTCFKRLLMCVNLKCAYSSFCCTRQIIFDFSIAFVLFYCFFLCFSFLLAMI